MKNESKNYFKLNKQMLCETCKETAKKPIFSKCGHSFCKNCILANLICPTCNLTISKFDLTENAKLKSQTKNLEYEESNINNLIYKIDIPNNKIMNDTIESNEHSLINNKTNLSDNNPNKISFLTKKLLKINYKNNINIINYNHSIVNNNNNNNKLSVEKNIELNNEYDFDNIEQNGFINELMNKYNELDLHNQNEYKSKSNYENNKIINKKSLNENNKNELDSIENYEKDENSYILSLKRLNIGKKRVHKEFIKGQNNLINEKKIKKYPMDIQINNIDKYNEETAEFFFDNFVNMFNPLDDIYERKFNIPDSEILGSIKKRKNE